MRGDSTGARFRHRHGAGRMYRDTRAARQSEAALKRTTAWAKRAREYFRERAKQNGQLAQWQFGIVQGATFTDLRRESARQLLEIDFPGYAVGGLAVVSRTK